MSLLLLGAGLGSSAAAFSPADIPGLVGWWKASELALSDSDPVSSWTDLSGSGNHLTAAGSERPTFRVVSGESRVDFDGADDELVTGSFAVAHWFFRCKYGGATFETYAGLLTAPTTTLYLVAEIETTHFFDLGDDGAAYRLDGVTYAHDAPRPGPMNAFGVISYAKNSGTWSHAWQIGHDRDFEGEGVLARRWLGPFTEIIAYSGALTSGQRDAVEAYLMGS